MYKDGKENKKSLRIIQNMFTNFAEPQGTMEHSFNTSAT
jgi:hypothetical protein